MNGVRRALRRIGPCLFILILIPVFSEYAAPAAWELCVGSAGGDPGATVTVPITLDDGDGVAGFQVDVEYNPAWLTLVGVRLGADTTLAGGWSINNAAQRSDLFRILAFSAAGAGLTPGFKEMALIDFDVIASSPVVNVPFPLTNCTLGNELGLSIPCDFCVQAGVKAAYPRCATVLSDEGSTFLPASVTIEPDDWVLWRNTGLMLSHTTTSGSSCSADGLWDAGLMPGGTFARQFTDPPAIYPYFCTPHCSSGHDGEITVTDSIFLAVTEGGGNLNLSWNGGSGTYRVLRSPNPQFVGTGQVEFVPAGGDTGTTLTDNPTVAVGGSIFYLVINK